MRIDVVGKHLQITEAIEKYAAQKAEKLLKFFDGTQQITIVCEALPQHKFTVELRVDVVKHKDFISHASADDLYAAIDLAVDKSQRQLRDFKEQLRTH
ncbi:MAG: ribosome-associated translation inhibitor RaiA [Phycisphaerales bacterium]